MGKLRDGLRIKTEDLEKQRQRIYELETILSRNELEVSQKLRNYESQIVTLKRDNE